MAAALAPALVVSALSGATALKWLPFSTATALLFVVVLGFPTYLGLRAIGRSGWWTALSVGAVIGFLPIVLGVLLEELESASVNGEATVLAGRRSAAGWMSLGGAAMALAGLGLLGAAAFWLTLSWTGAAPGGGAASSGVGGKRALGAGAVAMAVAACLAAVPALTADRSCHNPSRGRSITPQMTLVLDVRESDWPLLRSELVGFAAAENMDHRDASEVLPYVSVLSLSACRPGLAVSINEQRWSGRDVPDGPDVVHLHVYQRQREAPWRGTAERLATRLHETWPGRVAFQDGMGRAMSQANAMRGRPEATDADGRSLGEGHLDGPEP